VSRNLGIARGFPIHWEEESEASLSPSDVCPFTNEEIADYLCWRHYHYVSDEAPTKFAVSRFSDQRGELSRRFWLIEARDERGRAWLVIVGSGASCFRADRYMRRWMYGLEPDVSLDARQIFEAEIADQLERDRDWFRGRSRKRRLRETTRAEDISDQHNGRHLFVSPY